MSLNPMFQMKEKFRRKVNRQPRSDKKKDVKIPLTDRQKRAVKLLALQERKNVTDYSTRVISQALRFPAVENVALFHDYEDTKNYVHIRLSQEQHDQLAKLSIQWDVSIRQAAFRLLHFVLREEKIFRGA